MKLDLTNLAYNQPGGVRKPGGQRQSRPPKWTAESAHRGFGVRYPMMRTRAVPDMGVILGPARVATTSNFPAGQGAARPLRVLWSKGHIRTRPADRFSAFRPLRPA